MARSLSQFSGADFEAVRETARTHALDRYLSALLAPRELRLDLIALAAFAGEIERVPLLVSDAALGEIRLKWWLDWLDDLEQGSQTGNPVADVFADLVRRRGLSRDLIRGVIDARGQELYGAPFANDAEFVGFITKTEGALFQISGEIADPSEVQGNGAVAKTSAAREALAKYGKAYGGARQLLRLPILATRGRWVLPAEGDALDPTGLGVPDVRARAGQLRADAITAVEVALQEARASSNRLSRESMIAGLPAALVGLYLKALERQSDWLASTADISPLSRVWGLWRAHWSQQL